MRRAHVPGMVAVVALLGVARSAGASPDEGSSEDETPKDVRDEAPIFAYTYAPVRASAGSFGAQAYGEGRSGGAGGGARLWGAPIERLTLVGEGERDPSGKIAPSAAAIARIAGTPGRGFVLGALGKYALEGFTESEIESGLLLSWARSGWHVDANGICGVGLDEGEVDVEGRLRLGVDLGAVVRVGLDGQARVRALGDARLFGGRLWDAAGGPQMVIGSRSFFGSLTGGPTTMGIADGVGWTAVASVGATTL